MKILHLFLMPHRSTVLKVVATALLVLGMSSNSLAAEEQAEVTVNTVQPGQSLRGMVNSVHEDKFVLVIDDRAFSLERLIKFEGGTWTREQVLKKIKADDVIEIEVGKIDERNGTRSITSISLIN